MQGPSAPAERWAARHADAGPGVWVAEQYTCLAGGCGGLRACKTRSCSSPPVAPFQTQVGLFFKVIPISGAEWGISVAIGSSALLVSAAARLLGRLMPSIRRRRHGRRSMSLNVGRSSGRVHPAAGGDAAAVVLVRRGSLAKQGGSGGGSQRATEDNPRAVPRLAGPS